MVQSKDARGQEIDLRPVRGLIERIQDKLHPLQIWLFGSRARGEARAASDWDLFVVVADDFSAVDVDDPLTGWRLVKDLAQSGLYADVVACRASDFAEARNTPNTLSFDAAHLGVLIYER